MGGDARRDVWTQPMIRLVNIGLWITFVFVTASICAFTYLVLLDPIAPRIEVLESRIIDHSDRGRRTVEGQWLFEVQRVVRSSRPGNGVLFAYFESAKEEEPIVLPGGEKVIPDRARFEISRVDVTIEQGTHRRDRFWLAPTRLPPGDYRYVSQVEFCNIIRHCTRVAFPPIPISLENFSR